MDGMGPVGDGNSYVFSDGVVPVAASVIVSLRRTLSEYGIRQIPDFLNGMILAGHLLERSCGENLEQQGGEAFVDIFKDCAFDARTLVMTEAFASAFEDVKRHHLGVVDQSPVDMLVTAGMSAAATIAITSSEQGLGRSDALQLVCIAIVAAQMARGELREEQIDELIEIIKIKAEVSAVLASSIEEMCGPMSTWDL